MSNTNIHITSIEKPDSFFDDSNSGFITSATPVAEKIRAFTNVFKTVPSKKLQEIRNSLIEQERDADRKCASFEEYEDIKLKIKVITDILSNRPKFSVVVEMLSYDASGAEERLHNLPTHRTVDLYIDHLETLDFTISKHKDGTLYPIISTEEQIETLKNLVFYWGQNDFQPKMVPSVSVGDVIHLNHRSFRVAFICFEELTPRDLRAYKSLDSRDRRCFDNWKECIK